MEWKTLGSKIVYKNPWIKVREDRIIHPSGKEGIYGVVEIPAGIFTVALNSNNDILMVRQNRYCTGITSWELPGGGLKPNNTLESQAKEEIMEEGNAIVDSLELLGKAQTQPGITTQIDYFFLARGTKITGSEQQTIQQEEGIDTVKFFSINDALSMIKKGEISHGQSIAALLMFFIAENKIEV